MITFGTNHAIYTLNVYWHIFSLPQYQVSTTTTTIIISITLSINLTVIYWKHIHTQSQTYSKFVLFVKGTGWVEKIKVVFFSQQINDTFSWINNTFFFHSECHEPLSFEDFVIAKNIGVIRKKEQNAIFLLNDYIYIWLACFVITTTNTLHWLFLASLLEIFPIFIFLSNMTKLALLWFFFPFLYSSK